MKNNSLTTFDLNDYQWQDIEAIKKLIEPVILLDNSEEPIEIGCSKFGGTPDLPSSIKWPLYKDRSMVFFAQINLAEIRNTEELPSKGILYFFAFFEEPVNEYGPEYLFIPQRDSYKVIYFNGDVSELENVEFPNDLYRGYQLEENRVSFTECFQLPTTIETSKVEKAGLEEEDIEQLLEVIFEHYDDPMESILGTPQPIQYGVELDWARALHEGNDLSESEMNQILIDEMPSFINLLSFPMMFRCTSLGNSNCYFGIAVEDLKELNFDNALLIFQGT